MRHERSRHKIDPSCDLCVYGKAIVKVFPYSLQDHVQHHFPVQCVYCKRVFTTAAQITSSAACQVEVKNTKVSSMKEMKTSILSSTPTQQNDIPNFFSKISQVISPLDQLDSNGVVADREDTKGTPNAAIENKNVDIAKKRKVTFWDTPVQEGEKENRWNGNLHVDDGESEYLFWCFC